MRILCFGDSNTYGYIPDGSGRYSEDSAPMTAKRFMGHPPK